MSDFEKLVKLFERFPGIGGRQAKRFVHHLLTESAEDVSTLAELMRRVRTTVTECPECHRFAPDSTAGKPCTICADTERDASSLMVVGHDSDLSAVEQSGIYRGYYFVLGGSVPLLNEEYKKKLRGSALRTAVERRIPRGLREIILAFAVNPDGENTARYVTGLLRELAEKHSLRVSMLGRGLSTGSELEYADPETIKNAVKNRA